MSTLLTVLDLISKDLKNVPLADLDGCNRCAQSKRRLNLQKFAVDIAMVADEWNRMEGGRYDLHPFIEGAVRHVTVNVETASYTHIWALSGLFWSAIEQINNAADAEEEDRARKAINFISGMVTQRPSLEEHMRNISEPDNKPVFRVEDWPFQDSERCSEIHIFRAIGRIRIQDRTIVCVGMCSQCETLKIERNLVGYLSLMLVLASMNRKLTGKELPPRWMIESCESYDPIRTTPHKASTYPHINMAKEARRVMKRAKDKTKREEAKNILNYCLEFPGVREAAA